METLEQSNCQYSIMPKIARLFGSQSSEQSPSGATLQYKFLEGMRLTSWRWGNRNEKKAKSGNYLIWLQVVLLPLSAVCLGSLKCPRRVHWSRHPAFLAQPYRQWQMVASQPELLPPQPMTIGGREVLNGCRDNKKSGQGGDVPLWAAFACVFVFH